MELLVAALVGVALVAIKVGGYWLAARRFGPRLFPGVAAPPVRVALLRFALGVAGALVALGVGTVAGNVLTGSSGAAGLVVGALLQLVLRALAWLVVVKVFYDARLANRRAVAVAVGGGVALSYALDVPEYLLSAAGLGYLLRDVRFC